MFQGSCSPPASRSLPSSPTVSKWKPVKTGEGRKGGGRSFVEGMERGREGVRGDRREGGGEEGSRPLDYQTHTGYSKPSSPSSPSSHIVSNKTPQKVSSGFAKFSQLEAQAARNSPK